MIAARAVVVYALRESVRRRVFTVVLVLTALFLVLYGLGAFAAFDAVDDFTEG